MPRTWNEINEAMRQLEDRLDRGEISEKIFEMRYNHLQEELKHLQSGEDSSLISSATIDLNGVSQEIVQSTILNAIIDDILSTDETLPPIDQISHYHILNEVGRGSMGVVYKAEDINFKGERIVALKVLTEYLSKTPEVLQDFRKEFITASKLIHQNICGMYEFIEDKKTHQYCLVIEYLEGKTLNQLIKEKKKYKIEEALPIIKQIASGLDYAHSKNILHLDIKPANIMIDSKGNTKIMDFGIAQQICTDQSSVNLNSLFGTPMYVSPEQIQPGKDNAVRSYTDQWSLAIIVYEMLQGTPPFQGTNLPELTQRILTAKPAYIMGVPEHVQKALQKALSKDPRQRFITCTEFYEALNQKKPFRPVSQALVTQLNKNANNRLQNQLNLTMNRNNNNFTMIRNHNNQNALNLTMTRKPPLPSSSSKKTKKENKMLNIIILGILIILTVVLFIAISIQLSKRRLNNANVAETKSEEFVANNFQRTFQDNTYTELPEDLLSNCWDSSKELWDFTNPYWLALNKADKIKYSALYQKFYADLQALPIEKIFSRNGITLHMTLIPPGIFTMGSPEQEEGRSLDETEHIVTISKYFWMSIYEVTQEQYQKIMKNNPSRFKNAGQNAPVDNVDWKDAQIFCRKTSTELPTEAQWEYACRSGFNTMSYNGDFNIISNNNAPQLSEMAWYAGNSGVSYDGGHESSYWTSCEIQSLYSGTHVIGRKKPNSWGLYDMLGNVCEWCSDWYTEKIDLKPSTDPCVTVETSQHVRRGGSWSNMAKVCRAANRSRWDSKLNLDFTGFRVIIPENAKF